MQGGVLSKVNPILILSSNSLVMRNIDEMGGKILGYNTSISDLLEPEELDWQVLPFVTRR